MIVHSRLRLPLMSLVSSLTLITLLAACGTTGASRASNTARATNTPPVAATEQPTVAPRDTTIVVGTQQGRAFALRTDTGAAIWRWNGGGLDSLVGSATTVYIASHPGTNDGDTSILTALRATNGAQLWQVREPQLVGYTYMALDGDTLVVTAGDGDGTIYALDAQTGRIRWTRPGVGGQKGCGFTAGALQNRLITATQGITYIMFSSLDPATCVPQNGFDAYNTLSGKFLWQLQWPFRWQDNGQPVVTQGNNGPSVVAENGDLAYYYAFDLVAPYPASSFRVLAFATATGAVQQRLTQADIGAPLLGTTAGIVYTSKDNQFCAFHVAGGERLWCNASMTGLEQPSPGFSFRLVPTSSALLFSEVLDNGHAEVGVLDNATGRQIWSWQGPYALYLGISNAMSLVGDTDRLYLATGEGLYTFQTSTGKLLWHALATTSLSFIEPVLAG